MVLYAQVACKSSPVRNNKQSNGAEWLISPLGAAQEQEALRTGIRQRKIKFFYLAPVSHTWIRQQKCGNNKRHQNNK